MLTSVDVKFISIAYVYREGQEMNGCSGLHIYTPNSRCCSPSCLLCHFCCVQRLITQQFAVKQPRETSKMFRHFLCSLPKQLKFVPRPRLFKRRIALSTGVSIILIRWIVIYPVDSAIQRLNNRGQVFLIYSSIICQFLLHD